MALPSSRDLLTSLLSTVSSISVPSPAGGNPLRSAPASTQPLLATLHVLFPSLLLPALDLLDRALVARVSFAQAGNQELEATTEGQSNAKNESPPHGQSDLVHHDSPAPTTLQGNDITPSFYIVTSLASTMRRRGRTKSRPRRGDEGDSNREYLVQLEAWNCTCPSFTFDAFPPLGRIGIEGDDGSAESERQDGSGLGFTTADGEDIWSVGGSSLNGTGKEGFGTSVPCCKHILASVLADKWPALARNVVEKRVGRAELAAMIARI